MFLEPPQIFFVKLLRMAPYHVTPPGAGYAETPLTIQTLVRFQLEMDGVYVAPNLRGAVSWIERFTAVLTR